MPELLILRGCSPTPLSSYLKALGVLRLLSSGRNSVTHKPADPLVRGWWEGEQFYLRTSLERAEMIRFFLHDYAPSPVIAPWNGGSGFYPGDNKDGFQLLALDPEEIAERFRPFSKAIRSASEILRLLDLSVQPNGDSKEKLVALLRARLPSGALPWLDAALVLSGDSLKFPQLLGTGGNDGRLDFTNNLMRRLVSQAKPVGLFSASSGAPSSASEPLLDSALFDTPIHELASVAVGQFSPGGAGGPNATTGYEGEPTVNPWDYVLMLEGAAMFAGAATRRHQSNAKTQASFPFTVAASGTGWGGIEAVDESEARAEFWAPLWRRPARFCEIEALFGEGRAVTNCQTAGDGFDFARAVATLGVSRGFSEFQRYGFFRRAGKTHYAAAIGRRYAETSPGAKLIADLDEGGWLSRARRFGRDTNQAASLRNAVKKLEDTLFELLSPNFSRNFASTALGAIGRLANLLGSSPKGREIVPPPPLLSRSWVIRADDGSPEFRVASALAGIGIPVSSPGIDSDATATKGHSYPPPMAAHFVPLTNGPNEGFERMTFFPKPRRWANDNSPPTVVWGYGALVANMNAVMQRRLVEASIRGLVDKPLDSSNFARLSDVAAFLTGDFDDARCADLLAGMIWTQPTCLKGRNTDPTLGQTAIPFAYAALKPIFSTNETLSQVGAISKDGSIPIPPSLVARLRAGDQSKNGRVIDRSVRIAFARSRSSGLPSIYDPIQISGGESGQKCSRIGVGIRPDRLAASMLIPISNHGLASLLLRAYPGSIPDTIFHSLEETLNDH